MQSIAFKHRLEAIAGDDAGPDPVRAMTDINRLRLFPAVFTVTPDAEAKLPSNWGEPCVQLVTAASAGSRQLPGQLLCKNASPCI